MTPAAVPFVIHNGVAICDKCKTDRWQEVSPPRSAIKTFICVNCAEQDVHTELIVKTVNAYGLPLQKEKHMGDEEEGV